MSLPTSLFKDLPSLPFHVRHGTRMEVIIEGVLTWRPLQSIVPIWNGYTVVSIPVLRPWETLEWTAGSRIPQIHHRFHDYLSPLGSRHNQTPT